LFWRWKPRPVGRPRLPKDIQALIRQMATENPTWGQAHIANELKLKLGIRVSPRTVGKYLREWPRREPDPSQRWLTFVRNHAQAMVACDFFVVVGHFSNTTRVTRREIRASKTQSAGQGWR
jgi:putative transposase